MALLKKIVIEVEMTTHDGYGFFAHEVVNGKKVMITGVASPNTKAALTEALKDIKYYLLGKK